ncbi:MAG: hypothetical protein RLZZ543_1664 [Bacteroidota bacterium]|jgi:hypothetical protein
MKSFLLKVLVFSSPVIIGALALELFIRYSPNAFNAKANYVNTHAGELELLVFGSSHNQNAVNPEFLPFSSANLAYGGQDLKLDSALLFKIGPKCSSLKAVVFELDYHSLEELNDSNYFRLAWYNQIYGIKHGRIPWLSQISLYASEPDFFNDHIKRTFDPREYKYDMNEFGFLRNDFPGVFLSNQNDSSKIAQSSASRLASRHTTLSVENYHRNVSCLKSMINYCTSNNVKVFLVASPMYSTYIDREKQEKLDRRFELIKSIVDDKDVYFLNFEKDKRFQLTDFKNDDHLNSSGAEKYTKILGDTLIKLLPVLP